jgi:hypothetical protein
MDSMILIERTRGPSVIDHLFTSTEGINAHPGR